MLPQPGLRKAQAGCPERGLLLGNQTQSEGAGRANAMFEGADHSGDV